MADSQIPGSAAFESRYRVAGEGRDLYSRAELRERIRNGSLDESTEIAPEDSDDYQPAGSFPELQRYFSLVSSQPKPLAGGSTLVSAEHVAPPVPVASRLVPGALYPFTGFGAAFVFAFAMFELLPWLSIVSGLLIPLFSVAIVRVSSEGSTRMPPAAAFGGPGQILITLVKVVVITILSAWPLVLAMILAFFAPRSAIGLGLLALIAIFLYYPACLAILARYNTIRPALSVSQIWGFITTLGGDYALALGAGFFVIGVAFVVGFVGGLAGLPERLLGLMIMIPIVWGTFYIFHLIGWGMYNRRGAL